MQLTSMPSNPLTPIPPRSPATTPEQLAREIAWRRYNRFYLYLPLAFIMLLGLVGIGYLLITAVPPTAHPDQRLFVSALADLIFILMLIPAVLMGALLPALYVGFMVYYRREQHHGRGPARWLAIKSWQRRLWRLENWLSHQTARWQPILNRSAQAAIRFNQQWHGLLAFLTRFTTRRPPDDNQ